MFGGRKYLLFSTPWTNSHPAIAPPQATPEELAAQNAEATLTVQKIIVGSVLLYLCKLTQVRACVISTMN